MSLNNETKNILDVYIMIVSKVGDRSRGRPEGSFFNSYYTKA